jgi:electron transfer flavoprotein beta subunit
VVATIAPADAQPHLRNGLALGANRAVHSVCDQPSQSLTAARARLKLIKKERPDLVILGKQAIDDDDASQTGQMLATLWNPGAELAASLADLDPGDHRHFVCVEADNVLSPVRREPGSAWSGAQILTVEPASGR